VDPLFHLFRFVCPVAGYILIIACGWSNYENNGQLFASVVPDESSLTSWLEYATRQGSHARQRSRYKNKGDKLVNPLTSYNYARMKNMPARLGFISVVIGISAAYTPPTSFTFAGLLKKVHL
jgi:hypothetical protein